MNLRKYYKSTGNNLLHKGRNIQALPSLSLSLLPSYSHSITLQQQGPAIQKCELSFSIIYFIIPNKQNSGLKGILFDKTLSPFINFLVGKIYIWVSWLQHMDSWRNCFPMCFWKKLSKVTVPFSLKHTVTFPALQNLASVSFLCYASCQSRQGLCQLSQALLCLEQSGSSKIFSEHIDEQKIWTGLYHGSNTTHFMWRRSPLWWPEEVKWDEQDFT